MVDLEVVEHQLPGPVQTPFRLPLPHRPHTCTCTTPRAPPSDPLDPSVQAVFDPASPVTLRTMFIAGDADELVPPAASKALADRFANSELLVVEGGGHGVPPNSHLKTIAAFVTEARSA